MGSTVPAFTDIKDYVSALGGDKVIRKVLIANNGMHCIGLYSYSSYYSPIATWFLYLYRFPLIFLTHLCIMLYLLFHSFGVYPWLHWTMFMFYS